MSITHPPVLSPRIYLQYLQVEEKEPNLFDKDAILKAQALVFPPSSPIPMSQSDTEEVLIVVASSPSPDVRGHAQPIETPPSSLVFYCFCCGQADHTSFEC